MKEIDIIEINEDCNFFIKIKYKDKLFHDKTLMGERRNDIALCPNNGIIIKTTQNGKIYHFYNYRNSFLFGEDYKSEKYLKDIMHDIRMRNGSFLSVFTPLTTLFHDK